MVKRVLAIHSWSMCVGLALVGCVSAEPAAPTAPEQTTKVEEALSPAPMGPRGMHAPGTAPSGALGLSGQCTRPAHLVRQKGAGSVPPMSGAHVVPVFWDAGVAITPAEVQLFSDVLTQNPPSWTNPYVSWIQNQYGVGAFNFLTKVNVNPTNKNKTLKLTEIGTELAKQVDMSVLPPYKGKSVDKFIYMVYFPPGYTIVDDGSGDTSCTKFCGVHSAAMS